MCMKAYYLFEDSKFGPKACSDEIKSLSFRRGVNNLRTTPNLEVKESFA